MIGLNLLTEPQYSHFRILVDVLSIILCIVLFKYCARKRELPSSVLSKQAELNKLTSEVSNRSEQDKSNAATIAKTGPDLQQMNSDYRDAMKRNEELQQLLKNNREDIEQQQQEQDSVEDEMKRLENEEEANLLALKNKNSIKSISSEQAEKDKLAKEEAEKQRLLKIKEAEEAAEKLRILKSEEDEKARIAKEQEEFSKTEEARKEKEKNELIVREQKEKQRQEQLKETLAKGIDPEEIHIGSKVLVNGSELGIVRHYGQVKGLEGNYYGVEFDVPVGKNDGVGPEGDRYFVTKKNQGLFVPREKLSLVK